MEGKISGMKILFTPLKVIVIYLSFTLILYAFGPFAWITYDPLLFYGLNLLYIIMFSWGWYIGIKYTYTDRNLYNNFARYKLLKYLAPLLLLNLIVDTINLFRNFGYSEYNISSLFSDLVYGIRNPGIGYNLAESRIMLSGADVVGGWWMTAFNTAWGSINFTLVLLGLFYYHKLRIVPKVTLICNLIIILASYLAIGTNIGVFRLLLAVILFYWIRRIQGHFRFHNKNSQKIIFAICCGVLFMIILFMRMMLSRGGILSWNSSSYNVGGIGLDMDSVFFSILPECLYMTLIAVSSYLTQGYYGMSLCLQLDWCPTFGIGNSMAIVKKLSEYASDAIRYKTYQFRLTELGWEEDVRWHTMYSWYANDVSFLGVIIIMFFIGLLFAMAYKDSVIADNPYAHVMVFYFSLMAFFIPCNNQIFQSTYTMFSFIFAMLCWLTSRGRTKISLLKF